MAMTQAASTATSPLTQLLAQCREQPLVFDDVRPDLCASLEQVIIGRMQADRGRSRVGSLNVGGWKSGEDFFAWPDPAVQEFRKTIVDLIGPKTFVAWVMVNRAGSHHPRHQHRLASLTGVYYVTAGSPEAITPTVFECPCDGGPKRGEMHVDPHPGRLVLTPGQGWHSVPVYSGDLPRITVVFDVRR
jgi:hypothetical protein